MSDETLKDFIRRTGDGVAAAVELAEGKVVERSLRQIQADRFAQLVDELGEQAAQLTLNVATLRLWVDRFSRSEN